MDSAPIIRITVDRLQSYPRAAARQDALAAMMTVFTPDEVRALMFELAARLPEILTVEPPPHHTSNQTPNKTKGLLP